MLCLTAGLGGCSDLRGDDAGNTTTGADAGLGGGGANGASGDVGGGTGLASTGGTTAGESTGSNVTGGNATTSGDSGGQTTGGNATTSGDSGGQTTGSSTGRDGGATGGADGGMTGGSDADAGVQGDPDGVPPLAPLPDDVALPLVFVHGFAGSAQQYLSQAMRFEANGYPPDRIFAYEHDGAGFGISQFAAGLSDVVDDVLEQFGVEQIYLVAHSRGTSVSDSYLGQASQAAKVAKYVALDGNSCSAAERAGVPCVAPNQGNLPGQAHVEVATSAESFEMQYEFLIGEPPQVTEIVKQVAPVEVRGRALLFPQNVGRAGVTLEIWPLKPEDGYRDADQPLATFEIDESGEFGPVTLDPDVFYEMVLVDEGIDHHFYMQRILRDTRFLRLFSGNDDSDTLANTNRSEDHVALIASRMREWKPSDVLEIGTTSASAGDEAPVDIIDALAAPAGGFGAIAIHLFDDAATPGESTLDPDSYFQSQPFQNGLDLYMPAADPPDGVVTITNHPYGDSGRPQVLRMPNWPSSAHRTTLMFSDFTQD